MEITGVNHITIRVSCLERALVFYEGVLGMKRIHLGNSDAYLEWGGVWICLLERVFSQPTEGYGVDHIAFSMREDHFSGAVHTLQENKVRIIRGPTERGGGQVVNFLDPDGTELELYTGNLNQRMQLWR
ncbi:VOC family protein [Mechercharimyces sp. CAU 1602]|uniref:VOC family protein n=1 Tax=Mechercharimyces sp. CAU 1602 TaxID=2973933 RepID=UPI0021636CAE|nr:VOC family protein [Mechercharimyces sp. CAU 1602]MCS1351815.1 VOC family protein [Mechercharimyces sp. CAU 1602]